MAELPGKRSVFVQSVIGVPLDRLKNLLGRRKRRRKFEIDGDENLLARSSCKDDLEASF